MKRRPFAAQVQAALESINKFQPPEDAIGYWKITIDRMRFQQDVYCYGSRKEAVELRDKLDTPEFGTAYVTFVTEQEVIAKRDWYLERAANLDAILTESQTDPV